VYGGKFPTFPKPHLPKSPFGSEVVSEQRFLESDFFYWMRFLGEKPRLHSKQFQFYAIMDRAFSIIKDGRQSSPPMAIGFGVGTEPIPSALVGLGYKVVATDYLDGEIAETWRDSGQQSESFLDLNKRRLVTDEEFLNFCEFRNMDMNEIPNSLNGCFDFVWSSCALGHIGSYDKGLEFILNSLRLLSPGGWAVHTTELDKSELTEKFDYPNLSFYKIEDLESVLDKAELAGFKPLRIRKAAWTGKSEKYIVSEPWAKKPHLRIELFGREINSIVIQIQRPI
jgi:hypothetical protein